MKIIWKASQLALLVSIFAACTTPLGARKMQVDRFDYNQAIVNSWNEQLLMNLVQMHYFGIPYFLDVSSVVSQMELNKKASAITNY